MSQSAALSEITEGHFTTGEEVIARFTSSHRRHQFRGIIVGQTKNYWKIKSLESPYADQGEQPGRVFHIATASGRNFSDNNCILKCQKDQ